MQLDFFCSTTVKQRKTAKIFRKQQNKKRVFVYIDYISSSKAVYRNFPYTAVLDCFRIFGENNTQKNKYLPKSHCYSKAPGKKGVKFKEICMITKEQEPNERPFWASFKD